MALLRKAGNVWWMKARNEFALYVSNETAIALTCKQSPDEKTPLPSLALADLCAFNSAIEEQPFQVTHFAHKATNIEVTAQWIYFARVREQEWRRIGLG